MDLRTLESKPVYLTTINAVTLSLCIILQREGFDVRGIWDNNKKAHGKQFRGVDISAPFNTEEGVVVITNFSSFHAIKVQLEDLGISNICCHDDILSMEDLPTLLQVFNQIQEQELSGIAPLYSGFHNIAEARMKRTLLPVAVKNVKDALILPSVGITITDKCSLKCESCGALIQYIKNPKEYSFDNIKDGFHHLIEQVDYIRCVAITGGEAFLHSRLMDVVEMVCNHEKVATALITTNATIVPSDEICAGLAAQPKIQIDVSDYGDTSKNKESLLLKLEKYKIPHKLQKEMVWYDQMKIIDANLRTEDEVQDAYRVCALSCMGLSESLFSKCPAAVTLTRLNAIPPEFEMIENSIIDLSQNTNRAMIRKHLDSQLAMGACYVCSGKSKTNCKVIQPAIQTKNPLPYKRYD